MSDRRDPRRTDEDLLREQVHSHGDAIHRHEKRITRLESERPPPGPVEPMLPPRPRPPTPRGPSPSSAKIHRAMTPAAAFRPAFTSDPELRRSVDEAEHRRSVELAAQKAWAKGREEIDRELADGLAEARAELVDLRTGVAVIARELGVESLLPAPVRKSLPPPPGAKEGPAPQPLQTAIRQTYRRGRNTALVFLFGEVVLEAIRHGVFDHLGKVLLP